MKSKKVLLASSLLTLCLGVAHAAPTLVGTSTLETQEDLTLIKDGATTYEFLDFTSTVGMSQKSALALYGPKGFTLGTDEDVSRLFDSFGFSYSTNFQASGYPYWGTAPLNVSIDTARYFDSYLGITESVGDGSLASFRDRKFGQSYFCVAAFECQPNSFVSNSDFSSGAEALGVVLVRAATVTLVPEPSQSALTLIGLLGIGAAVARRKEAD